MKERYIFASESVTEGHPDKIADQISDAILDAIIEKDPVARVACETFVTTGMVLVGGEIRTDCYVDIEDVVRKTLKQIGYNSADCGIDYQNCAVLTTIGKQSPDIAVGVDEKGDKDLGAGDQGMMFGYAINETPNFMPLTIDLAHLLTKRLSFVRKGDENQKPILDYLRPDGKSEVTVIYENGKPVKVESVVISTQHKPEISLEKIREDIKKHVIFEVIPENLRDENMKMYINPTGRFVQGGPHADAGLTGRKIIVDTYGGRGSHGGGAFSGKDSTKVDRSASYMARYIAKNIVAAEIANECEVQLAYAIGISEPVSVMVNTFGTSKYSANELVEAVKKVFPLKPQGIIETLKLRRPIFQKTASYGHFGREDKDFTWEKIDKIEDLKTALK